MTEDAPGLEVRDCFVIMPFGKKTHNNRTIDFDRVYADLIAPAVQAAGLRPIRADAIVKDNLIGRRMFDRLAHAPYVLADGSFLNPNVFYELGVRHALRRSGTLAIAEAATHPPFDTKDLEFLPYVVGEDGAVADLETKRAQIVERLIAAQRNNETDSPVATALHDLDVRYRSPTLRSGAARDFALHGDERWRIGYVPGDLLDVRNIDAWVNSENRYMMMARQFDRSISGLIRLHGADRRDGEVVRDRIQQSLRQKMGARRKVPLGCVLDTGPGALGKSHGVKRLFHVAAVDASQSSGYRVENPALCAGAVLDAVQAYNRARFGAGKIKSLIMPLFGTGMASHSPETVTDQLVDGVVKHFRRFGPQDRSALTHCYFLVFTERDRDALERSIAKRDGDILPL